MKKTETLFIGAGLAVIIGVAGAHWMMSRAKISAGASYAVAETKFGNYLAAQHAVYVNDFDRAAKLTEILTAADPIVVQNTKMLAEFLSGHMPQNADALGAEKGTTARMIYDTSLITHEKWDELYKRHKGNKSAIMAPLRIWATVAAGRPKEAIKFVNQLATNDSWKAFVRGQIYMETGDLVAATAEFDQVQADFMNINDYLYLMTFYQAHDMADAVDALRTDFTSRAGSLYIQHYTPDTPWDAYAGIQNQLVFSLIQNVSHTTALMYTDMALMMLRMAEVIRGGADDTLNYYLGQYFYTNQGNCPRYFDLISGDSPLRPFAELRMADKSNDMASLARTVAAHPLFVPGAMRLIADYVHRGNYRAAMRIADRALADKGLNDMGRAFFLKSRAQINMTFNKLSAAQKDVKAAADIVPMDADILSIQAKIWAAEKRELDTAYEYAMSLVRQNTADVNAWDTLGRVVAVRDGVDVALDLLKRVGEVSSTCSSLFEQLGDMNVQVKDWDAARAAYTRAIELSTDGLTVRPTLEKKLRKLK